MFEKFEIFVHIGAGKTGSTAIQRALNASEQLLEKQGIKYVGTMFENSPYKQYSWQSRDAAWEAGRVFSKRVNGNASSELTEVAIKTVELLVKVGINKLIWSNEALFDIAGHVSPALTELQSMGCKVTVVFYLREHQSWARSAYLPWGIKHKTYRGEIKTFKEYFSERPVKFYPSVKEWASIPDIELRPRNYNVAKNIVLDFQDIIGAPLSLQIFRSNESPSVEETLFRALYANNKTDQVLPRDFDRVVEFGQIRSIFPNAWLKRLLPDQADLDAIRDTAKGDLAELNNLLVEHGQMPLGSDVGVDLSTGEGLNFNHVTASLIQVVFRLADRVRILEGKLESLSPGVINK